VLNHLISEKGQGLVADNTKIDPSSLSRFRSGKGALNIDALERIFEDLDLEIVQKNEDTAKVETIILLTKLLDRERTKTV